MAYHASTLVPAVDSGVLAIAGAVRGEKAVARAVVAMKLVGLTRLLEGLLGIVHVLWGGPLVLIAKESEQGTGEVGGHVDGRDGVGGGEVRRLGGNASAPAVDGSVEVCDVAGDKVGLAPAGAEADDANLAVVGGQGLQVANGALDVANAAVVGYAAGSADSG